MQRNAYQLITDAILARLEHCGPTERPWIGKGLTLPANAVTGRAYHGSNIPMLWITAQDAGYGDNRWATFKQWQDAGAKVRKGEHGTPVIWFKLMERRDAEGTETAGEGDDKARMFPLARFSFVFNVAQVDGAKVDAAPTKPCKVASVAGADALVRASGAEVVHGGNKAFFHRGTDQIHMPPHEAFRDTATGSATEGYYAVLLHELTHWTGGERRLNRTFGKRFGDQAYAAEELVAELGAAFLCAAVGIEAAPREDHAAYLASWIKLLKDDPHAFTTAASKAEAAAEYVQSLQAVPEARAA